MSLLNLMSEMGLIIVFISFFFISEKAPVRGQRPGCFDRLWKATKGVFRSSSSCAGTVVEPFIPPADPVLEPSSPAPVHSGVKTNNGKSLFLHHYFKQYCLVFHSK